ncbi:MAG TPA: type IX secretion system membrane protein PorP/SprF [Bacteroidales bacterium]|nr:type IX secretion system membrane protein PorP/SprF [Bacteroidales bacterium]
MKKLIVVLIVIFSFRYLSAQIAPVPDQYVLNPVLINPAATGLRESLSIAGLFRRQWAGIKGAPETIMLIADSPVFDGNTGLGFSIMRDKIGVTRETSVSGSYSYTTKAGEGSLSLGLKAGILATNTAWSELVALEPGDESMLSDSRTFIVPDFGFGAYYYNEKYFAGFSVPRLLGYRFNTDKNRYSLRIDPGQYYYLFQGGYLIDLSEIIRFQPSALLSLSPGEKMLLDINAHFNFLEKVWAGVSFRTNRSFASMVQVAINDQVKAAYSYYLDFGKLGHFSTGTHEIMLRFDLQMKADVVNPLIF